MLIEKRNEMTKKKKEKKKSNEMAKAATFWSI